jgi:hypothetical protein
LPVGLETWSQRIVLAYDVDNPPGGEPLEFRLVYSGPLLGSSRVNPRAAHKQQLRKWFHPQLRRLWKLHPILNELKTDEVGMNGQSLTRQEVLGNQFDRFGYNFVPLVTKEKPIPCSIEILLLRPDPYTSVIQSVDLDNRLKTLIDALRMPDSLAEVNSQSPTEDEKPFFVLVQDDSLISNAAIESDVLLVEWPMTDNLTGNYKKMVVTVVITVKLRPYDFRWRTIFE